MAHRTRTCSSFHLETIRIFAFIFAIACAYLVNYNALYCLLVFISGYILHASQLRLKRFWGTASFTIALSGAATFLAGFFTLSGDQVVGHLPLSIVAMVAFLLLPYSIIKDVPDIAGDKAHGIRTCCSVRTKKSNRPCTSTYCRMVYTLSSIIPWFFALGVIITILTFVIRPRWIYDKALLWVPYYVLYTPIHTHSSQKFLTQNPSKRGPCVIVSI